MVKRSIVSSPEIPRRALSARKEESPGHMSRGYSGSTPSSMPRITRQDRSWSQVGGSQETLFEESVGGIIADNDGREDANGRRSLFAETPVPRDSIADDGITDLVPRLHTNSSPVSMSSDSSASSKAVGKRLDLMDDEDYHKEVSSSTKISLNLLLAEARDIHVPTSPTKGKTLLFPPMNARHDSSSVLTCCTFNQDTFVSPESKTRHSPSQKNQKRRPAPDPSAFSTCSGFSDDEDSRSSRDDAAASNCPDSPIGALQPVLQAPVYITKAASSPACASPMKKPRETRSDLFDTRLLVSRRSHGDILNAHKTNTTISAFDLGPRLGAGSFSEVFAARRKSDGIRVALKRAKQPFRTYRGREAALVEARTLAALNSKYIIGFYDAWQQHGHLYLQLELCELGNIAEIIAAAAAATLDSMPIVLNETPALWRLVVDVARGLDHVHSQGFVHLDLKPANVLLTPTALKLADFGLATAVGRRLADGLEGDARYLAPELLLLDDSLCVDPAADVFSLGLTLFELTRQSNSRLCTALPSSGPAWHDLRSNNVPTSPRYSDDLNTILINMLQREPSARPTAAHIANHARARQAADVQNCGGWLDLVSERDFLSSTRRCRYDDQPASPSHSKCSPPDEASLSPLPNKGHPVLPTLFPPPIPTFETSPSRAPLPLQQHDVAPSSTPSPHLFSRSLL